MNTETSVRRARGLMARIAAWPTRAWWPWASRLFTLLVVAAVLGLLWVYAVKVDWAAVFKAMRAYDASTLWIAGAISAASYLAYAGYDLIGRHQLGLPVSAPRAAGIGFVSYAFNLNLGSLVGNVAIRYRLYAQAGVGIEATTQLLGLCLLTNWLGHLFVGGLVFVLDPVQLPPQWHVGPAGLRLIGCVMVLLVLAYVLVCARAKRREYTLRGHALRLPSWRFALLQLVLASSNWLLIAAVIHTLMPAALDYPAVLSALFIAAVAGVVVHVPAGLGVLEAVFVLLLSYRVPQAQLLAALLTYRAIYFLLPLALAAAGFFVLDRLRRSTHVSAPACKTARVPATQRQGSGV